MDPRNGIKKWKESIAEAFPIDRRKDALNVLCLLLLNRFRDVSREEVIGMMNFDLLDTRAGQDIYEEGMQEGIQMGALESARASLIVTLEERFQIVPATIIDKINSIDREEILGSLFRQAMRCSDMDGFNEVLSKAMQ